MTSDFDKLINYIERNLSFHGTYYEKKYLKRRIRSRMKRSDSNSYREYLSKLKNDKKEQKELLDTLKVNVTKFFRNKDVWSEIDDIINNLVEEKSRPKMWSAACSDGREAYSLAMIYMENNGSTLSNNVVTATDIDDKALEKARKGIYKASRTVDIKKELSYLDNYNEYIDENENTYKVKDKVKNLCKFKHKDLIADKINRQFDLILCRNVFIYVSNEYKMPIFKSLKKALKPGGYLIIGKTETMPYELRPEFETINRRLRIHRKK
ncbi:protein-glutamate O-methyltransferase CheR [Methanonatronarchaeum sp. AMET6-2]|uniref:CheR family methyltransferase n=1 Tax=Methanonatronarchaeum sp. AMET6-2 TaxID=2933293 RepID=UPI00120F0097|nr:protein-glutamate O-methyltransferase CheR [Methanonatronarchaeum sp. AMET6-2]RZN61663.1 MAG: protein-glutamate O-methyltransferase CheR [Methanonatronarchaeia archaeon]UOY10165.1 protein-glutamate O-methyltransferase CheR [Methanonatronarchaeum sp. AMET6-2]